MIFFLTFRRKIREKNLWFGFGKDFLGHKDKTIKEKKLVSWIPSKLKICSLTDPVKKMNRQTTDWEKYLKNMSDKEFVSFRTQLFKKSNKMWAKDWMHLIKKPMNG